MNNSEFHALTHLVMDSKSKPPLSLFAKGYDDWHVRARLAHFLVLPEFDKQDEAIELFRSIVEVDVNENSSEDIEEKVYALQHLSITLRDNENFEDALHYINLAIELAEDHDFLYKYILRGELWADRWNLLTRIHKTDTAYDEVNDKIAAYGELPVKHISYLYYGYRFFAQLAGANFKKDQAIDFMKKALSYLEIPKENQELLDAAMSATHENTSWILLEIDKATPSLTLTNWDI
ncbi:tetratricopeptide repeat protein [Pectinatus brassicae]|uniref:Tetratricopeptide (TPR) repeat protein n=1 Tax=Pectinatus brassicae TaxID=862415 RepID=A0A840UUM0_9FIRM|nr:tetratricopeptide repeat protein [Pectinatus brassicae]MBB5336155.1 tetratricopeptide (TPR) repeat protein [Pectinatus brassicae]